MRALHTVVAEAEQAVAGEDTGACASLLRELLEWVSFRPSPAEKERINQIPNADSDKYLSLPVTVQVNPQMPGGVADTPQGEMVFFNLQLVLPFANLRATRVLGANGQMENPADGMLPTLDARWVIPQGRIAPHVLQALGLLPPVPTIVRE